MGRATNPHDALFRRVFSDPENAAAELRHVLPRELARAIDWETLKVCEGSWVDGRLRSSQADLLCSVELAGRPALVYVLLEHKSWPDRFTALQLLSYGVRIWRHFLRDNPRANKLPPIVSVVVHHSESGWRAPTDLIHLVDIPPELWPVLAPFVPDFRFALDDLTTATEDEIAERTMSALGRLALFCLKRARHSGDVCAELRPWAGAMRAVMAAPSGAEGLAAVLSYIMGVVDTTAASKEQVETLLAFVDPEVKETVMPTIAEQLKQEGRVEGRAEGRAELLMRLLTSRFGEVSPAIAQRLREATPEQVDAWAERILTAQSLEEMFEPGA